MAHRPKRTTMCSTTIRRAIDTVTDPEFVDMNVLTVPGLTLPGLTGHIVDVCEERGDSLGLIDLPNVYIPTHESYKSDVTETRGTNPLGAALDLSDRRIDSSYGATFYPWVQTRDDETGQLLWIPPSVASWSAWLALRPKQMYGSHRLDSTEVACPKVLLEFQLLE
jgi:hypothetical protein